MTGSCLAYRAVALALLAGVVSAGGQVHVVDDQPGPGVDFTDLQAAIDAAADGDVLLIKEGSYQSSGSTFTSFLVESKALTLIAEVDQQVTLVSPVWVRNSNAGRQVVLRGIDVVAPRSYNALIVEYSGAVLAEDGRFWSQPPFVGPFAFASVWVWMDGSFIGARCSIEGGPGSVQVPYGGDALQCQFATSTALYGCELRGGAGSSGSGGAGAGILTSMLSVPTFVFASGSSFTGGMGGSGASQPPAAACSDGAPGGAAVQWVTIFGGLTTQFVALEVAASGGAGGPPGTGSPGCSSGPGGLPVAGTGGSVTALPGQARSFVATSPVREGQSVLLKYRGVPGELVFVGASAALDFEYAPDLAGVEAVASPQVVFLGVVPSSGILETSVLVQDLGPGVEGALVCLQSAFVDSSAGLQLGPPSMVVLLDAAL